MPPMIQMIPREAQQKAMSICACDTQVNVDVATNSKIAEMIKAKSHTSQLP